MPIVLRHNPKLELSRVEYFGRVQVADLHNHAAFNAANPIWLGFDCVSVLHSDIEVAGVSPADLDGVFTSHRQLFEPLNLMFMRRSAWVCESAPAQRLLSHWLTKCNADRSPWSEVRQFDRFDAAGEWMLLTPANIIALKDGDDFTEIARFQSGLSSAAR